MTTVADRPNSALLVIDVQNRVVAHAHRRDDVIANINTLVDRARARDVPVVWVQHSDDDLPRDSESWQYVPELVRRHSEPLVHKCYGDSFEGTELEALLAERGVGRLIVTVDPRESISYVMYSCAAMSSRNPPVSRGSSPAGHPVSRLVRRFLDACESGGAASPGFAEGYRVQCLMEAAWQAHASGRWMGTCGRSSASPPTRPGPPPPMSTPPGPGARRSARSPACRWR